MVLINIVETDKQKVEESKKTIINSLKKNGIFAQLIFFFVNSLKKLIYRFFISINIIK